VIGEAGHTRGGGPAEVGGAGATHGTVGDTRTARGAVGVVGAACGAVGVTGAARGGKPRGTTGTRRGDMETTSGVIDPARRGVPIGRTTGASSISKKFKLSVEWDEAAKGKTASSKTTYWEITRRLVERSRQQQPLWWSE
jgi:hypothetical protein